MSENAVNTSTLRLPGLMGPCDFPRICSHSSMSLASWAGSMSRTIEIRTSMTATSASMSCSQLIQSMSSTRIFVAPPTSKPLSSSGSKSNPPGRSPSATLAPEAKPLR